VDWAALHDPHGVDSARGAASALVAQARARDARGLQVIESEPGAAPKPPPIAAMPAPRAPGSGRPPATVLWWKQHRATLAGSAMALAAAAVISWVAVSALRPVLDDQPTSAAGADPAATASVRGADEDTGSGAGGGRGTTPARQPTASKLPAVTREKPQNQPEPSAPKGKSIVLRADFLFDTGSTRLTRASRAQLKEIADQIRASKVTGTIRVKGYTDDVGSVESNLQLSLERAQAVALALQSELGGVVLELTYRGFGEPKHPVTTTAGRAAKRRVVITLPAVTPAISASPSSQ